MKPGRKVDANAKRNSAAYVLRSYHLPIDVLADLDLLAIARPHEDKSDLLAAALRAYLKKHRRTIEKARDLVGG